MSPNSRDRAVILFSSGGSKEPAGPGPVLVRQTTKSMNTPKFLVTRDRETSSWWGSLKAIFARVKTAPSSTPNYVYLFRTTNVGRFELASRPLGASFVFHCSVIVLLVLAHRLFPPTAFAFEEPMHNYEKIYYTVPPPVVKKLMPRIAPQGTGGKPGSGFVQDVPPALGSTTKYGDLTIVSRPVHRDNFHQTIIQPNSPPDLIIKQDLKLPNIVVGNPTDEPKAAFKFKASDAKPTQANRQVAADPAPTVAAVTPQAQLTTFLPPSNTLPKLAIPTAVPVAPVRSSATGQTGAPSDGGGGSAGEANGLLVISTDPAPPGSALAVPPGNRYGEFSLSPYGSNGPGSPGGSPNGVVGGGSGGHGTGGDGSTGVGPGNSGGGGGDNGGHGIISINGGSGDGGGAAPLSSGGFTPSMVYAVPVTNSKLRKNSLVVSAGSIGGGGLNVYNVLHCGKIYSIYLPMPNTNWAMEYCQKSDATAAHAVQQSTVIHLESGIVPPNIESQFDFRRLPIPEEKAHHKIVLKGTLKEDGTISDLEIYQGVLPAMDEAAKLAMSQWKFKPAMRDGKAISVEILVGIPAVVAE